MNNSVFGNTKENVRKHRDIKLVKTNVKRNKLVSKSNYHTTKHFQEICQQQRWQKKKLKMNQPVYLGMTV